MSDDEVNQIVKGLLKHSEPYRQSKLKQSVKPIARRKSERDKALMECFRNR